jgi:RNA polymerase sigma factor (sigma-70 family)
MDPTTGAGYRGLEKSGPELGTWCVTPARILSRVEPNPRAATPLHVVGSEEYPDWESAYRDNVVGIYQYIYRRVGNQPDAEDLADEVFIHTLRSLRLPALVREVRAYLVKTARTVLADHWRRHYAMPMASIESGTLAASPPPAPENQRTTDRAARILALLPDRSRQLLELRFLRAYSVREAAKELGITEANARVLQFRALKLAAKLGEALPE